MRKVFLLWCLLLCVNILLAGGEVKGVVRSSDGNLAYVSIVVQGTSYATASDFNGNFSIKDLPPGQYAMEFRYLGYQPFSQNIEVTEDKSISIEVYMQRDILGLQSVTITGNREEENRKSSTVIVDVMNKQQLDKINALTFSDGIKFSPGIRTETNCQNCGFSQVRINGLPGTYSQVLIDGRATFSALNSIYGIEQIPVEMLERIEVVKGGGSALYGSNAIAGTINIITSQPTKSEAHVNAESDLINGKTMDYHLGGYASLVQSDYSRGLSIFTSYRNRGSYDHDDDGYSELPTLNQVGAGVRAYQRTGKFGKLNLEFHMMNEYRRGGNKIQLEPHEADIAEELKSDVFGGGISYDFFSKNKKTKLNAYSSLQSTDMDNYYGAEQDLNGYGNTSDISTVSGIQLNHQHQGVWKSKSKVLLGAEYKSDYMKDNKPGYNLYVDQDLRTAGFYGQYEALFAARFKLSLGARYDWYNLDNQGNVSPRLNVMYNLSDELRLRSGYARGFRIPQVFSEDVHVELVAGGIQAIQLAEGLSPELSDSYTLSLDWDREWKKGVFEVVLEGFLTQIHNPFILEAVDSGQDQVLLERRNGSGALVTGCNLEFKITDQRFFALQSSFTLLQSEYEKAVQWSTTASENQFTNSFLRTPSYYGNLALDIYPMKNMTVVLTTLYTGPMWVEHYAGYIPEDQLERTSDFIDIGLNVAYNFKLSKHNQLKVYGGVKNILNQYQSDFDQGVYRDASYIYGPQQARTYVVGLKYALK